MFKFLKIRTSESGDALRHVPFASIIHKHVFPLFICFVFVFCHFCSLVSAFALADPQPQFDPIYDTDIVNFQNSYNSLNPAAQAAANIMFGAYLTEYAGLADYGTVFDSVPTEGTVWDRLQFAGQQFVDTIFLPVNFADQVILSPLLDLGQGIVNKVKGVNSVQGFTDSVFDASVYGLSYTPDIGYSLNQLLAREGGLYNWQFQTSDFSSSVSWSTTTASSVLHDQYQSYLTNMRLPRVFANESGRYNVLVASNDFLNYHNMFINPSRHAVIICDDFGNPFEVTSSDWEYLAYIGDPASGVSHFNSLNLYTSYYFSFDPSDYDRYQDIIQDILDFVIRPSYGYDLFYTQFIDHFYYGNSWSTRSEVTNSTDLGFIDTSSLQVLNPKQDVDLLFDLKALVQQLADQNTQANVERPLQPIVYNITQVQGSGDSLSRSDLEGLSFNVTPPQSGIDVPSNTFAPFFQDGGILNYFWYMTKPMVVFTRDVLDVFTFGPEGGFTQTGPGYFVLGAVALGLLGGVVVKFLL